MTALFLQTLHNGPLSQDDVRAELDFVHCGYYPLSEMEKISLLLGLQWTFAFLMILTLNGPKLSETDEGLLSVLVPCRLNAALFRGKEGRKTISVASLS